MRRRGYKSELFLFFTTALVLTTSCVSNVQFISVKSDASPLNLSPNEITGNDRVVFIQSWTRNGLLYYRDGYINFPIQQIDKNRIVKKLELITSYFYDEDFMHKEYVGQEELTLEIVSEQWDENSITWNNLPATNKSLNITLKGPENNNENFTLDLTEIYRIYKKENIKFHGIKISSKNKNPYRIYYFSSKDFQKYKKPIIKVTYY